ncbi:hypothetical protein [Pseudarthrobacter enclensis]
MDARSAAAPSGRWTRQAGRMPAGLASEDPQDGDGVVPGLRRSALL